MESNSPKKIDISQLFSKEDISFDYYSCEEAITRLNGYLDHELSPDELRDVVKHLKICTPCLERFHFEEKLIVAIRTRFSDIVAPESLKGRLRNALEAEVTSTDAS